jgi:hypothetical protein
MLVNLKAEMIRFNITAEKLGEAVNRSGRAMKRRLDGTVEISSEDIRKIRDVYFQHCSLDYLLSETPCIVYPKSAS